MESYLSQGCDLTHISDTITSGQSEPGSDGNKKVLPIPYSSSITGALPSECSASKPGLSFGESYFTAEVQSVYSAVAADWAPEIKELIDSKS